MLCEETNAGNSLSSLPPHGLNCSSCGPKCLPVILWHMLLLPLFQRTCTKTALCIINLAKISLTYMHFTHVEMSQHLCRRVGAEVSAVRTVHTHTSVLVPKYGARVPVGWFEHSWIQSVCKLMKHCEWFTAVQMLFCYSPAN